MERRLLTAVLLSAAVLILWTLLSPRPHRQPPPLQPSAASGTPITTPASISQSNVPVTTATSVSSFTVTTDNLLLVFNTWGAGIREVRIREKHDTGDQFFLLCSGPRDALATFPSVNFSTTVAVQGSTVTITFTGTDAAAGRVVKTVRITPLRLAAWLDVSVTTEREAAVAYTWNHYLRIDDFAREANRVFLGYGTPDDVAVEQLSGTTPRRGDVLWAAVSGRHFLTAMFPETAAAVSAAQIDNMTRAVTVQPVPGRVSSVRVLLAPKSLALLNHRDLRRYKFARTIDLGWFAPLSRLFDWLLRQFHALTGNYGVSIILLTLIIQLMTLPLTVNQLKSTRMMREIQPKIQALQKIYKDDQARLGQEMMNLYKEYKYNPLSGCLPLLLQMPVFIALFSMLNNTYDLRGASFALWISDLSQPDRFPVPFTSFSFALLPILMGGLMFLQQASSGSLSDPNQRMMALVMPVVITVIFFNMPSGLVLYWLTSNVLTIIVQTVLNRTLGTAAQPVRR